MHYRYLLVKVSKVIINIVIVVVVSFGWTKGFRNSIVGVRIITNMIVGVEARIIVEVRIVAEVGIIRVSYIMTECFALTAINWIEQIGWVEARTVIIKVRTKVIDMNFTSSNY